MPMHRKNHGKGPWVWGSSLRQGNQLWFIRNITRQRKRNVDQMRYVK